MARIDPKSSNLRAFPTAKAYQRIEFPSLTHFIDELADENARVVRADVFEQSRQTELSFVYYITLTLFVTALDDSGFILYEFQYPVVTITSAESTCTDEEGLTRAKEALQYAADRLTGAGFIVRDGRYSLPDWQ